MPDIPKTLHETYLRLKEMPDVISLCVEADNADEFATKTHHSLGRWIRNEWNLWKGCSAYPVAEAPLYYWFYEKGLRHPDDISGIICTYFFIRHEGNETFEFNKERAYYQNYWQTMFHIELNKITDVVEQAIQKHDIRF